MLIEMLVLSGLVWVVYANAIHNGFVSDDIDGLERYDGKFKGWDYGHLNKWILYRILGRDPVNNHTFSIFLHNFNVLLLYLFLIKFFSPEVSFLASALFAVHPVCTQSVSWISGRGYPISLFFVLLNFNLIPTFSDVSSLWFAAYVVFFAILYYVAVNAQFAVMMSWVVLAFYGHYFLAVIGFGISLFMGLGIIREVIGKRAKVFHEQNMARATQFSHKRFIVAVKTFGYYTALCAFPRRLGLYHVYGYHYDDALEREDNMFWISFVLLLLTIGAFFVGPPAVKLGILWYLSYLFIFMNWIVIHQFVTERYVYIPVIGLCLIAAHFLVSYPVVAALIIGMFMARAMAHQPTYANEVSFYQSNIWNFPDSEIAFSNMGVTYLRCNLIGSAVEMWRIALKINKDYDVAAYNIAAYFKQKGNLPKAIEYIKLAVASPQCHFKDTWGEELKHLESEMAHVQEVQKLRDDLLKIAPEKRPQAVEILKRIDELQTIANRLDDERKNKLKVAENNINTLELKLNEIKLIKGEAERPVVVKDLIEARNKNFEEIKKDAWGLLNV